jgi:hypothetical protein
MKTARRILGVVIGAVAVVFLAPILFALLSASGMRGYFEDGRCACGYASFIHITSDDYFVDAPLHGMPEDRVYLLHQRGDEWDAEALPSPAIADNFTAMAANTLTPRFRVEGGDLYTSWSGSNWTRHARVYNPWRIWLARLRAESPATRITCVNNLKQIGLTFRLWAIDHHDQFPFNVGTNAGGTREFCVVGNDGFDRSAALHFQVMSNELNTPRLLVCPEDRSKKAATNFACLEARNVTYRIRSGANLNEAATPREALIVCPVDGNILYCDGTVKEAKK